MITTLLLLSFLSCNTPASAHASKLPVAELGRQANAAPHSELSDSSSLTPAERAFVDSEMARLAQEEKDRPTPQAVIDLLLQGKLYDLTLPNAVNPLAPFGDGLHNPDFVYQNLLLSAPGLEKGDSLTISVMVTNKGGAPGQHSVLLFSREENADPKASAPRLRSFQPVGLAAGESKVISFTISPQDLASRGPNEQWITKPGDYELAIGPLSVGFSYYED
ncbi:fibronectin type III-like domain-contianing protein [Neolewinella lacunae]|uniref:Fibronectin type III-like domain-contianing protein n=1 Tax=Neolewinella lacunae TaxID=1517758 RepID=A0A923PJ46_9BACT|nr:fibronectin type III-like domain-contianing protein [Neolewinella lacunae]MBC6993530.1 fibronectin type III-like domain-contianing protein [Neolewinella lacunae]MDN3636194.1 fibronectin type III-like domain-contianing protein [Neolewinella lacunae]